MFELSLPNIELCLPMIQFALIGCGRIAKRHAENINRLGKLVAVCDIDANKAIAFAEPFQARVYTSIDDLLKLEKSADVLVVCTPNGYHAEHVIKALQARKHVLCEKPMCLTSAAAWQIMETEKFSRKKLMVVKSARFNPLLQQLKNMISSGALGKIYSMQLSCFWHRPETYYTDWHGKSFPDGGTLYTQFSHYIDSVLWLFGDILSVQGYRTKTANKDSLEFEDTGVASVLFENNLPGTINWSVNAYQKNYEVALTVLAEKGTVSLGGEYLQEVKYQQLPADVQFAEITAGSNDYETYKGSMSHHTAVYDQFMNILNHSSEKTNSFDGMKTVAAIEKIYQSVSFV